MNDPEIDKQENWELPDFNGHDVVLPKCKITLPRSIEAKPDSPFPLRMAGEIVSRYLWTECGWDGSAYFAEWPDGATLHLLTTWHGHLPWSSVVCGVIGFKKIKCDGEWRETLNIAWVAPLLRRQGILRRSWADIARAHRPFEVLQPTEQFRHFLTAMGEDLLDSR